MPQMNCNVYYKYRLTNICIDSINEIFVVKYSTHNA